MAAMAELVTVINAISTCAALCGYAADSIRALREKDPEVFHTFYDILKSQDVGLGILCQRLRNFHDFRPHYSWEARNQDSRGGLTSTNENSTGVGPSGKSQLQKLQDNVNKINRVLQGKDGRGNGAIPRAWLMRTFNDPDCAHDGDWQRGVLAFVDELELHDLQATLAYLDILEEVVDELEVTCNYNARYYYARRLRTTISASALEQITTLSQQIEKHYREPVHRNHGAPPVALVFWCHNGLDIASSILSQKVKFECHQVRMGDARTSVMLCCYFRPRSISQKFKRDPKCRYTSEYNATLETSMRAMFREWLLMSDEQQSEHRRRTYYSRMTTAIYVTAMTTTLLTTGLVHDLTTERLKTISTNGHQERVAALVGNEVALRSSLGNDRQFLKLGVLLAELALAQPIILDLEASNTDLRMHIEETGGSIKPIARGRLLLRVRRATSLTYEEAVAHCFIEDEETKNTFDASESIPRLVQLVFTPLVAHLDIVKKHRQPYGVAATDTYDKKLEQSLQFPEYRSSKRTSSGLSDGSRTSSSSLLRRWSWLTQV